MRENITIEGARIIFRNFTGKGGQYNAEGIRNFCILLDDDLADTLIKEGWNIRWLNPKDPQDAPQGYVQVAVRYDKFPPKIVLISSGGQSILDEASVNILDWAEIAAVDVTIHPSDYTLYKGTRNEKRGVKAYVKSMWVTIVEDRLEKKYMNPPDSATDAIGGCGNCEACDGSCGHNHLT